MYGKLVFRNPLHEPRVHEAAPPGLHVSTVQAYDPGRKSVLYNLLDVRDHAYFAMESASGNISTARKIDKNVGDTYEIIAVAISQGETKLRQLTITVTEFNAHPPEFEHDVYRGELHVRSKVGTTVLKVRALDKDTIPYNAEVYYKLEFPDDPRGRFILDPQTGVLTLARSLESGTSEPVVNLGVTAVDGGSPKRSDHAKIEVLIKTISEPREVRSANATGSTVQVCWGRPEFGQVLGYIVKYREVENPHGQPAFLNITSDAASKCSTLVELKPWTDYEYRVYGWNRFETGQGSTVGRFGTRPDYCQMNICQHGECHVLNEEPGYHCDCATGFYGEVCDKFDPCSLTPCDNFGVCRNISSNKYRCDCLSGFSGQNCSEFNPCALRPSPCQHGGRCESTASHKYQCYCTKGYYGKTCQFYDPCSTDPCQNGAKCQNASQTDYVCKCVAGYAGKQCELDIDECASSPCKHGATCRDGVNAFHCKCQPGYRGKRCHLVEHCSAQTVHSGKGVFRWNSTSHGRAQLIECPFGSSFPESATGYAKRRCYLLSNGSVTWGRMDLTSCREEGFKNAEDLTGELWMLTEDPRHLNVERLQEATKQIEGVIEYAIYDKKIAHNMLSIVSNMLAINESLLRFGDLNGTTTTRVTDLVDRFASEVKLERGESITLETENLVVRAVSWDPSSSDEDDPSSLSFAVHYQARQRRDQGGGRSRPIPPSQSFWDEGDPESSFYNDAELTIPLEALQQAQNQTYQELRIKFVAYRNDKFFREKQTARWRQCYDGSGYSRRYNCLHTEPSSFQGRRVLQASISNATVTNLSDPVVYILPSPLNVKVYCAYWKESERVWSTEGLVTNQTGNSTACMSTHLTSFSLLLDPTPNAGISEDHLFSLSLISYIGCGLSMLGLILTIITYSLFRCLNRDHPGKILLHLCTSMLLMNAVFVLGSQRGVALGGVDVCVGVAILVHYFLLTTLSWMCVEAINMYQLLIHVFASSESHFMLKRIILAWGIPLIIVGVTVLMDYEVYYNQNEYCMLSASNPYVYYLSFVAPSCVILFVNLSVFLMVTRVLFAPRSNNIQAKKPPQCTSKKDKFLVTTAQVRGAFTVMVLLGVSWVFGAFAVGEARLVFQYIFCVSNSLQGFLIFLVRCLQYPEARSAWYQLFKTGTFKKYRGTVPPGSWSGNSNSGNNKQNGHSTTTRLGSADLTQGPFSTNAFWSQEKASLNVKDVKEDVGYDHDQVTIPSEVALDYATVNRGSGQLLTFSGNTLKEDKASDMTMPKSVNRSNSEASQEQTKTDLPRSDMGSSHYTFGLNPSVVAEAQDSDNEDKNSYREALSNELPIISSNKDIDLSSLPNEPKGKGSYNSSIDCIDEGTEKRDKMSASTLDRKIYASKASSVFGHIKPDSPPDKQNSWPRTLSSFMGGKEPQAKFTVSDMNATNQRHFGECPERHSFQIIPLQVRPSTPSGLSTFNPGGLHSPFSDTASLPDRSRHGHIHKPHHHSTPDRYTKTMPMVQPNNRSWQSPTGDDVIIDEECQVTVSGPQMRFSPGSSLKTDIPPEIFRIWEEQGLVSPNEELFSDSAASRL
ncbi:hypothetical protein JTE90_001241 [Oedothorax gibbosus]|uniref:Uncharacterized protein n=1 Tax=Oedothorax gibbosus TaxID=931172 RepID=A0AAV6VTN2_9ARAC|nr:hypothetical protein JTE90_001241 [Oedothorax gibbosus]